MLDLAARRWGAPCHCGRAVSAAKRLAASRPLVRIAACPRQCQNPNATAQDADALGLEGEQANQEPVEAGPFELQQVIETLKTVFDPEIPVNVVDLGLIYVCEAHPLAAGGYRVEIKMSMTAPGCGMGDVLKEDACTKVRAVPGVTEVDFEIVWDPPWDASRMSEAARLQLGML